jgi:sarcosine oxidase
VSYDIIIAGLGATGSATALYLAGRGARVLGIDRHHPPHEMGSSHGGSRVIRASAFEGARYVPLARRAYANWRHMEELTGAPLLQVTGVLFVGSPDSAVVGGTLQSAREHGVPHELISEAALAERYRAFRRLEGVVGVLEPGGGWLDPERCVAAGLAHAAAHGIELRFDEPLLHWEPNGSGVTVTTVAGRYTAGRLLLAAGSWMPGLLGEARGGAYFSVERQVQHWFIPQDRAALAALPIFIRQTGDTVFYALPPAGADIKVAVHHAGAPTSPETVRRSVDPEEIAAVRSLLLEHVPAIAGTHRRSAVCLYTNSRDGHFVIDQLPGHPAVLIASACSGFGFKFASALGEILADLLTDRAPSLDVTVWRRGASLQRNP